MPQIQITDNMELTLNI